MLSKAGSDLIGFVSRTITKTVCGVWRKRRAGKGEPVRRMMQQFILEHSRI